MLTFWLIWNLFEYYFCLIVFKFYRRTYLGFYGNEIKLNLFSKRTNWIKSFSWNNYLDWQLK